MTTPATYSESGVRSDSSAKLESIVFGIIPDNHELLKQAYHGYLANGRLNLAVVKTRGLVSGGGKKPWKQKGTGRARFGSSRNPIWRGGGIVFGPTGLENYTKHLNTKAKRLALRQALSLAADSDRIKVIQDFNCKDGKVSQTVALLKKIEANGRTLIVVEHKDALVERATRNLPNVSAIHADYINVFDTLNADVIVFSAKALASVTKRLADSSGDVVATAHGNTSVRPSDNKSSALVNGGSK